MACSEFFHRASEEKSEKIWYFIQIHDIQIASDRGCQYNFSKIPETLKKKIPEKIFFTHNVIYTKNRKLVGNLPINIWRFTSNYLVINWSLLVIWHVITWHFTSNCVIFTYDHFVIYWYLLGNSPVIIWKIVSNYLETYL